MRAAEKRTKMRRSSWIFFLSIGRTSDSAAAKAWILENGCGGNFSSGNALYLQNCKDNKKLVLPVNHHDYLELLRFLEGKKECLFFFFFMLLITLLKIVCCYWVKIIKRKWQKNRHSREILSWKYYRFYYTYLHIWSIQHGGPALWEEKIIWTKFVYHAYLEKCSYLFTFKSIKIPRHFFTV